MRRRVQCWFCGKRARRVPREHVVRVIGRKRTVQGFGPCGAVRPWGETCTEPMLRRRDALAVLRAAREHERRGGNRRSEYDA